MIRTFLRILLLLTSAAAQQPSAFPEQIGRIDFFGYGGISLDPIKVGLPVHVGDRIQEKDFKARIEEVRRFILQATGRPLTDLDVVCCDPEKHFQLFIGLPGTSYRPLHTREAPVGSEHLEASALRLYNDDLDAIAHAVSEGQGGEDDSMGYALTVYPAARRVQLKMVTYSAPRVREFVRVLQSASDPVQRRAAATLLGYVPRSAEQVAALNFAAEDADSEVRNNAVRALAVLSSTPNPPETSLSTFVGLLYSGKWSDRNKASLLLFHSTASRNPALLRALREQALPPLLEGATWDFGHAYACLVILARIEGLSESAIQSLTEADAAHIIHAAPQSGP